jgi:chromate transporter
MRDRDFLVAPAMSDDDAQLWTLAAIFAVLSFLAVGGVNAVLPEMHRQAVDVQHWMTSQRFTDLFALAQAAPGPNLIVVTLVGWQVAGLPGAVVATLAMIGPTSVLAYFVGRVWHRFRQARWRVAIQNGLTPVTIGLVAASAYVLSRAADTGVVAIALTLVTAAALALTRMHPFVFLAAGAALGAAGLI